MNTYELYTQAMYIQENQVSQKQTNKILCQNQTQIQGRLDKNVTWILTNLCKIIIEIQKSWQVEKVINIWTIKQQKY